LGNPAMERGNQRGFRYAHTYVGSTPLQCAFKTSQQKVEKVEKPGKPEQGDPRNDRGKRAGQRTKDDEFSSKSKLTKNAVQNAK